MQLDDFNPTIGAAYTLEPGLRRIVAPNPSPMTYRGTNTYLLGPARSGRNRSRPRQPDTSDGDPERSRGPGEHVSHIIVTHSHRDHSPLARALGTDHRRAHSGLW